MFFVLPLVLAAALPTAVESVVNAAYVAPPELGADVLIRLAESSALAGRAQRLDLSERAFSLAEDARYPLKTWPGPLRIHGRDSTLTEALDLGLSKLDLQCRAAKVAFALDHARGIDLFERIPPPQPPPLSCSRALAYRVDRYYDLAADIFERGFTGKQRKHGEDVDFIERLVSAVTTPAQIEPTARMLGRLRLAPADYVLLVSSFGRAVGHVQTDPRSFGATLEPGMLPPYLELANRCRRYGCSPVPLLEAMRTYLVTHLTGPRCGDVAPDIVGKAVAEFNAGVTPLTDPTNPQPAVVSTDEISPSRTDSAAAADKIGDFDEPELSALLAHVIDFTHETTEADLRDFIAAFDSWKEVRHLDPVTLFYIEGALFTAGLDDSDLLAGPLRQEVMARTVAFFRDSPVLRESPPEWYLPIRELMKHGETDVAEEMRRSGGPVMAMYVDLERLLSGPAAQTSMRLH